MGEDTIGGGETQIAGAGEVKVAGTSDPRAGGKTGTNTEEAAALLPDNAARIVLLGGSTMWGTLAVGGVLWDVTGGAVGLMSGGSVLLTSGAAVAGKDVVPEEEAAVAGRDVVPEEEAADGDGDGGDATMLEAEAAFSALTGVFLIL